MNVVQRPGAQEFCATLTDYIIDTDATISFEIAYNGKTILSEEYVPDATFQVRIRQLGKFCALALWGVWCDLDGVLQNTIAGNFTFRINGEDDTTSYVMFSRMKTKKNGADPGWLSEVREKVTRVGVPEYASILLEAGEQVVVSVRTCVGETGTAVLYTQYGSERGVATMNASYNRIVRLFPSFVGKIQSYSLIVGSHVLKFLVDHTGYSELRCYRYKNVYDVPEVLVTVGGLAFKGNQENETGYLYGIERKFGLKVTDEYTARSGTIFLQSDYKLWHNMMNAQEVQLLQDGDWYSIIITKQNFEREMAKSALKEVEFSFRMADSDENNLLV